MTEKKKTQLRIPECCQFTTDDGRDAFALVVRHNEDESVNLAWLDPDNEAWHSANGFKLDDPRIK